MGRLVCAIFQDERAATSAVQSLVDSGIDQAHISAALHEGHVDHDQLPVAAEQSGTRSAQGAAIGALVGGIMAGPAGLLLGGPLAAVLLGVAGGGLYGALAGAISGRDTEHPDVVELRAAVERGHVLVTVDVHGEHAESERVADILASHGGHRISVS
jgi:hypothetical protein